MKKVNRSLVKKLLPKRIITSNKTDGGKVMIIGGGTGLYGAGLLSALAATTTGAGYTHLMTDLTKFPWLKFPDFILHPMKLSELKDKESYVVAIGPGMGLEKGKQQFLKTLLKNKFEYVIVDADALTLLSQLKVKLPSGWILTPHEGELARLLNVTSLAVKKDRLKHLKLAQEKYGCIVLLKGPETLIIDGKDIYAVTEGTTALAKAGTGDVLLGMIAGLLAQNKNPLDAAIAASFIHGHCSKMFLEDGNDHLSLRPVDIIERIPKAIKKLRG